jgi:hypothetical protein
MRPTPNTNGSNSGSIEALEIPDKETDLPFVAGVGI